ncbi:MAG TPA: carboxymuconolactone decarboxylase family protein [Polyangiaceae bacterium]|nr:carboxymuconolactone decarboxylase family protein [Polyangiaceae bacterium]
MHHYAIHTLDTAPEKSRPSLAALKQNFGLIPNLAATMAESPTLVNGFVGALANFMGGSFNGAERQVLLLTNAVTNRCAWAVAFHSTAALKEGVAEAEVEAIRDARLPKERRLAALSALTRNLIEKRGHLDEKALADFTGAGFAPAQVLEVIAGLAASVMANYAGNITKPPLEAPFEAQAWRV